MSEIDRFLYQAMTDPSPTRIKGRQHEIDDPWSTASKQKRLKKRVTELMILTFNDPKPSESMSMICGRSVEYWDRVWTAESISKANVKLISIGLRAHIMGIRDHLSDIDAEVRRLTDTLDDSSYFKRPPRARALGRGTPWRPGSS